jgi:hypothetical protein
VLAKKVKIMWNRKHQLCRSDTKVGGCFKYVLPFTAMEWVDIHWSEVINKYIQMERNYSRTENVERRSYIPT